MNDTLCITTNIQINPASDDQSKHLHCENIQTAVDLTLEIVNLEQMGHKVLNASGARHAVPSSYRRAYKTHAPYYVYVGAERKVVCKNAFLQNRPRGAGIPAWYEIAGSQVPEGFRCFKRNENSIVIRKA